MSPLLKHCRTSDHLKISIIKCIDLSVMESFAMVIHKTKNEFRTRMAHFAEIYEP